MARDLFTSWSEFQAGVDRLLALARQEILIHDHDLARLNLDSRPRREYLKRLLHPRRRERVRIALQDISLVQRNNPHLRHLAANYSEGIIILEVSERLRNLSDTMILVDGCHGIVLFERSQPRSILLIEEPEEIKSYGRRFEQIWLEGGTRLSTTTLGL